MEKAAFSIDRYLFPRIIIDLSKNTSSEVEVSFKPSGIYDRDKSIYELSVTFTAFNPEQQNDPFVIIDCIGLFKFINVNSIDDIPAFFYRNSIAILFPYIRAFVSMTTLQANIPPLILPTMNLASLEKPLQENTIQR